MQRTKFGKDYHFGLDLSDLKVKTSHWFPETPVTENYLISSHQSRSVAHEM